MYAKHCPACFGTGSTGSGYLDCVYCDVAEDIARERIKEAVYDFPEETFCQSCNGSGEGYFDGQSCQTCKGRY